MQNNYKFNVNDIVYGDNEEWIVKERYILNDVNYYKCFINDDSDRAKLVYEKTFRESEIDSVAVYC